MKANPPKLLWIDLEMTGLDPETQRIIEVAAIITDIHLQEIDTFEAIVSQSPEVLAGADTWVKKHMKDLLKKVSTGENEKEVVERLSDFTTKYLPDQATLAGNSIHQDRRFIRQWWPSYDKLLHYRMLDVSSWKVMMHGRHGIDFDKQKNHRALDDIRESIAEMEHYMQYVTFDT